MNYAVLSLQHDLEFICGQQQTQMADTGQCGAAGDKHDVDLCQCKALSVVQGISSVGRFSGDINHVISSDRAKHPPRKIVT